jgi:hypothetical protein
VKRLLALGGLSVIMLAFGPPGAGARPDAGAGGGGALEMYRATLVPEQLAELTAEGYDVTVDELTPEGARVALVLSPGERRAVAERGIDLEVWRDARGRTQAQAAAAQARGGYKVYRPYDGPNGIAAELRKLAKRNRKFVQLKRIGRTLQGRPILALRVTKNARKTKPRKRPAVLYQGTTHAREWISTEVTRRLARWFIANYKQRRAIRKLLSNRELWFVPVVNPDGYQFTFEEERLWRKNLRDVNGNGQIEPGDGIDLNRNYPERWGYDEEGSSSEPSNETYRGSGPASEPETRADMKLLTQAKFRFAISYHSFGPLILYPQGWQLQTPTADDPIYVALSGTDENPAVPGFDPDLAAELYTTNGEFTDWAHAQHDVLAWTVELNEGCDGCGFVFPDNPKLVREEFERNLRFARNLARSARDPDDPVSHAGIKVKPFYLNVADTDPYKANNPLSDLRVLESYAGGGEQPVEVLAKRSLGKVTLRYRVNDGPERSVPTKRAPVGERYGGNQYDAYYRYLRGTIPDLQLGDEVTYWFTAGKRKSKATTFEVTGETGAEVLILAAEDRTGASADPPYPSSDPQTPNYLSYFTDAVTDAGHTYAVYDIDARGRRAPDHLGVLSHFDAVLWYTGNDLVLREPGWGPGNASRLANDLVLEVREYLNEGGKLLYTGQWAGALENGIAGAQFFDPIANEQCVVEGELVLERCELIADKNDFLQYFLGAYVYSSDAGTDSEGDPVPLEGVDDPFAGETWTLNGAESAGNQVHTAAFVTTSSLLRPDTFPQFESAAPVLWEGAAGSFDPDDGEYYVYSRQADMAFKRFTRTIDLTGVDAADEPTLTFRTSYDIEPDWDWMFVEAHTVGEDDWTTLPDENGATTTDTGESCAEGWFEVHPWLERYQGADCSGQNPDTGGEWHGFTGRSAGWTDVEIDLSQYAGSEVEVSISYASDWAFQGLGAFIDSVEISTGEGSTSFEEDEDPLDGWAVGEPPEGSGPNPNSWERTTSVGFAEGAVVATPDSLTFGFGLEAVDGADARADLVHRSLSHLLGSEP